MQLKAQRPALIKQFARPNDLVGVIQVASTLSLLLVFWWVAAAGAAGARWLSAVAVLPIALMVLRAFVLMHDCGHGSLFCRRRANRAVGFILGVVTGMPQYVWAKHHSYHHANNGNWENYRGPFHTLSVDEYTALTKFQRRLYRIKCGIAAAPLAGFVYLIFNPRFTWMYGSVRFLVHVVHAKLVRPDIPIKVHVASFRTRYWKSAKEYWHMFWNNVVLLSLWAVMIWALGAPLFFAIYIPSVSLAGAAGIIVFTVQHNFEHSYASDTANWDHDASTLRGTSFLVMPRWLNWVTVNGGYHHVHHMSVRIPSHQLVRCHNENRHLFAEVTRLRLSEFQSALKCILWDVAARRIISVAEYEQRA
jgi:omega-6 fatty acid desaturase (delta-12 desaturase)